MIQVKTILIGVLSVFLLCLPVSSFADNQPTETRQASRPDDRPEVQALVGRCESDEPSVTAYMHRVCIVGWNEETSILIVSDDPAKVTYHAELVQHCVRMSSGFDDPVFQECFLDY